MGATYLPGIDQVAKMQFEANYHQLASQRMSKLEGSGVVVHMTPAGKSGNLPE